MSLRSTILQGGALLVMRQAGGIALSVVGMLVATRLVGAGQYGIFATSVGLILFLSEVCSAGIDVALLRRAPDEDLQAYHLGFWLLLVTAALGIVLASVAVPFIGDWVRMEGFEEVYSSMLPGLAPALLSKVPQCLLDRRLRYGRAAMVEFTNQLAYQAVSLTLALLGFGVWALVVGWWAGQLSGLVLSLLASEFRPARTWNGALAREIVTEGIGYSLAAWIWRIRDLVNPLIVARYAGPEAVAAVAIALRIAGMLSIPKTVAWRVSLTALSRLTKESGSLTRAVGEGMELQLLSLAPVFIAFQIASPLALDRVFGSEWEQVAHLFPFIAVGILTNALFSPQCAALYVRRRNFAVGVFHVAHVSVFLTAALLLIPTVGFLAYGLAELAALPSYALVDWAYVSETGYRPRYRVAFIWWFASTMTLLLSWTGPWILLLPIGAAALPGTRQRAAYYLSSIGFFKRPARVQGSESPTVVARTAPRLAHDGME